VREIPKEVVLDLEQGRLFVDGQEFPWSIAKDPGVSILEESNTGNFATCTVTFFAHSIRSIPRSIEADGPEKS
jgi:hypothetical protein